MRNVSHGVREEQYSDIVRHAVPDSWADDIATANEIESSLWAGYEERFVEHREVNLAYRLDPANADEAAAVLKYFPPRCFVLTGRKEFLITCKGICPPDMPEIPWSDVRDFSYVALKTSSDCLLVTHRKQDGPGNTVTTIELRGLSKEAELQQVLNQYRHRHRVMVSLRGAGAAADEADALLAGKGK
jgi:hypothetical protein